MVDRQMSRNTGTWAIHYLQHDPLYPPSSTDEALIQAHARYIQAVTSRTILLGRKSTLSYPSGPDSGPEYRGIPYVVRGTETYTRRSQGRAYGIVGRWQHLRLPAGMFITISPRPSTSLYRETDRMKKLWTKYTNAVRMHTVRWDIRDGHRLRPKERCPKEYVRTEYPYRGAYVWAIEPHPGDGPASEYPHYHMALGRRVADKEGFALWTLAWWQSHGVDIEGPGVDIQYARGSDQVGRYVVKYVTKGCNDALWSAMLWLTGWRSWGASRVLGNPPINSQPTDPQNPEWEMIGIVPTVMIEWIMQDRPPPDDIQQLSDAWIRQKR